MIFRKSKPAHSLPGWRPGRGYDLVVPSQSNGDLLIVIHGFTHDGKVMSALTSPNGDPAHSESLDSLARQEGLILCYPNGTPLSIMPGRCWNGGGGRNGYCAVAKKAVDKKVDDVKYLEELIKHLSSLHRVERVFLTGISNGAALAHRFATERPELVQALAVVAGCNQHAASEESIPPQPVPLLHIHGSADPIWPYDGGIIPTQGRLDSVASSLRIWAEANSAHIQDERELPEHRHQELKVNFTRYEGKKPIELYRVEGGGHTWPGGQQYLPKKMIGPVHPRFSASRTILSFLKRSGEM